MTSLASGLTDRFGNTVYRNESGNMAREWILLALYVHFLIWKEGVCKDKKKVIERHRGSLNSKKQKFVSFEQFPDVLNPGLIGVSGELSQPNDMVTSRKGCCHNHQFISVLWVDTPFSWSFNLDLLPLPHFAENVTFWSKMATPFIFYCHFLLGEPNSSEVETKH